MKLSNAQEEVLSALRLGSYLWTNEGNNFKAWIGDYKGNKQKGIKIRTVEILLNKGHIQLIDGDYRPCLFKYGLNKTKKLGGE